MIIYAKRERDNKLITQVQSLDTTNVDIRLYSHDWYKQLNLPGEKLQQCVVELHNTADPVRYIQDHKQLNAIYRILYNT